MVQHQHESPLAVAAQVGLYLAPQFGVPLTITIRNPEMLAAE